jgi:hypothetical protein
MFRYTNARTLTRFARPATSPRFLTTSRTLFAAKDTQDKDSLHPQSTEYSKSGSDDAAAHSDAAFNPKKTSPEEAEATAESEQGGKDNSLNASPGNKDISEPVSAEARKGAPEREASGGGSAPKAGGNKSG